MNKNRKRILIGLIVIISMIIAVLVYFLFIKEEEKIIELNYETNKEMIAFTLDGQEGVLNSFPNKGEGYIVSSVTCTNGTTATWNNETWTIELSNINPPTSCVVDFTHGSSSVTLASKILSDNPNKLTRNSFDNILTTSNNGNSIYYTSTNTESFCDSEDLTYVSDGVCNSYYFSGAVSNNYVKFGKDASDNDIYWKVVRINEDGSVRLVYLGTDINNPNASIGQSSFGYLYEYTQLSMYSESNNWYNSTLNTKTDGTNKYDSYVSRTATYCHEYDTNAGSGYFNVYNRLSAYVPQFKCDVTNHNYSVSNTTGNGALAHPIGYLTADELAYAGAFIEDISSSIGGLYQGYHEPTTINNSFYLYEGTQDALAYLTMTPAYFEWVESDIYTMINGSLTVIGNWDDMGISYEMRPVISLKSCVTHADGNGLKGSPYEVSIDSECVNSLN